LLAFEKWSAQEIEKRQEVLIKFGRNAWWTAPIAVSG
jgi:hypothetical protein